MHEGAVATFDSAELATSEIATYGSYFAPASDTVQTNTLAGIGARTRPARANHQLAKTLGYGAVACVTLS